MDSNNYLHADFFSDILNSIRNYIAEMSDAEITSTVIIVSAALLLIILERFFPYTKGQKIFREGFFDDFALYSIAQSYILGIIIFGYIIRFIDNSTGISRLNLSQIFPSRSSDIEVTRLLGKLEFDVS